MRAQPLIAVSDVEVSSRWYQRLLGCQSAHGGTEYERLVSNGVLVLQLEIDDFDAAVARAVEMKADVLGRGTAIHRRAAVGRATGNSGCLIPTATPSYWRVPTVRLANSGRAAKAAA